MTLAWPLSAASMRADQPSCMQQQPWGPAACGTGQSYRRYPRVLAPSQHATASSKVAHSTAPILAGLSNSSNLGGEVEVHTAAAHFEHYRDEVSVADNCRLHERSIYGLREVGQQEGG